MLKAFEKTGLPCKEWNYEWLAAHPGSDLHTTRDYFHIGRKDLFERTCCHITARAITWKLGYRPESLRCLGEVGIHTVESFRFCLLDFNDEHQAVLVDGVLYQSYFKEYEVRGEPLTEELRKALDTGDWKRMTGVEGRGEKMTVYVAD